MFTDLIISLPDVNYRNSYLCKTYVHFRSLYCYVSHLWIYYVFYAFVAMWNTWMLSDKWPNCDV